MFIYTIIFQQNHAAKVAQIVHIGKKKSDAGRFLRFIKSLNINYKHNTITH